MMVRALLSVLVVTALVAVGPARGTASAGATTAAAASGSDARTLRTQLPWLQVCYQNQRAWNPGRIGKVTLLFTINRAGRVKAASLLGLGDELSEVRSCLTRALRRIQFRARRRATDVRHALLFRSGH